MAPPPVQIVESMLALLDHGGLVALCQLGVPDALDGPVPLPELARALGVQHEGLERLVRYGAARGWLALDTDGRVVPTSATRFLRSDHPGGWRAWVEFAGGPDVTAAVGALGSAVREDADAFRIANGNSFFEHLSDKPERGRAFDAAMAAGARLHGLALARGLQWSSSRRVCDVGGGDGSLLRTLLSEQRHLSGVLLDLAPVVAHAEAAERLTVIGGDAFASVPGGCDTYLFVNVIHDWADKDAIRLLESAAASAPPAARFVVVDGERTQRPTDDLTARTDLLMLALAPGGRERTVDEIRHLADVAGLRLVRSVRLFSNDLAHLITR